VDLRALRNDAADALEDLFEAFSPGMPREALLQAHDDAASSFLAIGVATLLVDGNADAFFLNLCRCAENGRRLLALFRRRALDPPPASRNVPLLAALAAGDLARADAIAALSRDTLAEAEREYQDEFLWALCLQRLARAGEIEGAALEPVLARLAESGGRESEVAFARALLARDGQGLAEAFAGALVERETEIEERAKAFTTPVTDFAPHRFIWLEGLALLRLAERAGLGLDGEYRYCPRLARLPMTARYEGDWALSTGLEP
jgi:hypothetical protein